MFRPTGYVGDFVSGVRNGVNGTPMFFVNAVRYDYSWDFETLEYTRDYVHS